MNHGPMMSATRSLLPTGLHRLLLDRRLTGIVASQNRLDPISELAGESSPVQWLSRENVSTAR